MRTSNEQHFYSQGQKSKASDLKRARPKKSRNQPRTLEESDPDNEEGRRMPKNREQSKNKAEWTCWPQKQKDESKKKKKKGPS